MRAALLFALFVPAFLVFYSNPAGRPTEEVSAPLPEQSEPARPRELVKIYSILKSHRPDISDHEAWSMADVILAESVKRHVDPLLVLALIRVESGFQSNVVSPSGARGLMQIMPDTGRALAAALWRESNLRPVAFKTEWLDDPHVNIRLGIYYLHDLKKQFQDLSLALSAYNFGPVEIQNRLENNLEFPSDFAALVLQAYERYKRVQQPPF
ncbi:MAG TPA: lytic transglycosylase domain-containing protein [Candidatus Binatia bacterium]|nr:lytic transglycosylase domain-containing protein [Candidatus Binatia bacterium]